MTNKSAGRAPCSAAALPKITITPYGNDGMIEISVDNREALNALPRAVVGEMFTIAIEAYMKNEAARHE